MMTGTGAAQQSRGRAGRPDGDPERRCLATRAVRPKGALIRFVVGPDGAVVPDPDGRLPGRGLWVSAERAALERAVAKRLFGRAARRPVTVPDDLVERVEAGLARRCVELLALARRAGLAVAGFEKVRARLRAGEAALVLAAADGAADGRGKLRALAAGLPVIAVLDGAEIGGAFGRDHAVHVALSAGALTDRLRENLGRLAGVRGLATTADDGTEMAGDRRTLRH